MRYQIINGKIYLSIDDIIEYFEDNDLNKYENPVVSINEVISNLKELKIDIGLKYLNENNTSKSP